VGTFPGYFGDAIEILADLIVAPERLSRHVIVWEWQNRSNNFANERELAIHPHSA
jgi:hypothetical protein